MASPAHLTILSLTGRWHLNKALSDSQEAMLQHQSVPFLIRKTMAYAKMTIDIDQYIDSDSLMHIDSKQSTMGRVASIEPRTADWTHREQENQYFGKIAGRCRIVPASCQEEEWKELDAWLKEGWGENQDLFQSVVTSLDKGWAWIQIWGFGEIQGGRFHMRRLWLKKGDVVVKCRLVYDWEDSIRRE